MKHRYTTTSASSSSDSITGRYHGKLMIYSLLVIFAVISFVFYHFIVFPLFLDYGVYGVFATIMLLALLVWLLPKDKRLYGSVLFIGYLLLVRGLYHVGYKSLWQQLLAFVCLTVVFYIVARLIAGKVRFAHILTLSLIGGLLFSLFDQEELFFAKKFQVLYKSPKLFLDTNVDYFPLQLADVTGDGQLEIITQGFMESELESDDAENISSSNTASNKTDSNKIGKVITKPGRAPMQIEPNRYLVFQYQAKNASSPDVNDQLSGDDTDIRDSDGSFLEIGSDSRYQQQILQHVVRDYVGFPYYEMQWSNGENFIHRYADIRKGLLSQGMLQMDFFHSLEDEISVDDVDKLWIKPSYLSQLQWDLASASVPVVGNVDNSSDSVDNSNDETEVGGVYEILVPKVDRLHLIQSMLPFGKTPFKALELSRDNINQQAASWNQLVNPDKSAIVNYSATDSNNDSVNNSVDKQDILLAQLIRQLESEGTLIIGQAKLTNSDTQSTEIPELVVYRDGLEVYQFRSDSWVMVARLTPEMLREVANGEFILADITNDGISEVLLSASPSQVLRLVPNNVITNNASTEPNTIMYDWEQLWVAQDDIFRFETVTDDGLILALSQSYKRNEARRYLTAYEFAGEYVLQPVWRTSNTVINVRAGDVTGDGTKEIVASYFRDHQFIVLSEHGLPVQQIAWILTGLGFMLVGSYRLHSYRIISNRKNSASIDNKHDSNNMNRDMDTGLSMNVNKDIIISCVLIALTGLSLYSISDNSHVSALGAPIIISSNDVVNEISNTSTNDETNINKQFTDDEWNNYLTAAINYTNAHGKRFWYSGWVATKVQKRQTNSMYDGIVVRDNTDSVRDGILINARMLGQPFSYYESGDNVYIQEDSMWQRLVNEAGFPVDWIGRYGDEQAGQNSSIGERMNMDTPFSELNRLLNFNGENNEFGGYNYIKSPVITSEEPILGVLCNKVDFIVREGNTTMEWSIWVGKDEPYIYQYNVETLMPIPSAGTMQQTTFFRFWKYNDEGIQLTDRLAIEKQIVQRELRQIEDIEHALADEDSRRELSDLEIRLLELRLTILKNNVDASPFEQQQ